MSAEKTEQATEKKLREARRKGQVAKSKELGTALVVLTAAGALAATGGGIVAALRTCWALSLGAIDGTIVTAPTQVLLACASLGIRAVMPLLVATLVAGTLASVLQTGPLLALDALSPDLSRLNPLPGLGRMFTRRQGVELAKSLAKILLVGWIAWGVLRDGLRGIVALAGRDADVTLAAAGQLGQTLLVRAGVAMLAVAILDVFFQRWQFAEDQKMSKDEVKREHKESEGDPHTKGERERLRREILAHDVIESVRRADVLVVNPTHLAVALKYDEEGGEAPEVVAKGQDDLAQRMIEAARQAGVPVMRDVPLAHALSGLDLGDEIPELLYEAVAAVLRAAWSERDGGER